MERTRQDLWRAAAFHSRKRLHAHGWPAETLQMVCALEYLLRNNVLQRDALVAGLQAGPSAPAWLALSEQLEARLAVGTPTPTVIDMMVDMRELAGDTMDQVAGNLRAGPTVRWLARAGGKAMVGSPLGPLLELGSVLSIVK